MAIDAGNLECETVDDDGMPVDALEDHRPAGDGRIEVMPRREFGRRPAGFDPAAPDDPRIAVLRGAFAQALLQGGQAFDASQVEVQLTPADARQMRMRVSQARQYSEAPEIHPARIGRRPLRGLLDTADVSDAAVDDEHGVCARLSPVAGVDDCIGQQQCVRRQGGLHRQQ